MGLDSHILSEELRLLGVFTFGSQAVLNKAMRGARMSTVSTPGGLVRFAQLKGDNSIERIAHDARTDEYGLRRTSARAPGLLIDVGANVGDMTIAMAQLRPQKQVVALEPVPSTYFVLRLNLLLNNVTQLRGLEEIGPRGRAGVLALNAAVTGDPKAANASVTVLSGPTSQDARIESAAFLSDQNRTRKYLKWRRARVPMVHLHSTLGGWPSVELLKIDCELCEYQLIPQVRTWFSDRHQVRFVAGELHSGARIAPATRRTVSDALVARGCKAARYESIGRWNTRMLC